MLIFNCTKAAADFFTVTRQGVKQSPLQAKPPTPINQPNTPEQPLSPWLVHVIKVRRKTIIIAMHIEHRYAMVFCGIKKGDWMTFTSQFVDRLFNNMQNFGEVLGVCDEESFYAMLNHYATIHGQPYFCQRGDRSVQSHLSDVAWHFENNVYRTDTLPTDSQQCAAFDGFANSLIRTSKNHPKHFFPDEEMFVEWLENYSEYTSDSQPAIREGLKLLRRNTLADDLEHSLASIQQNIASSLDNAPLNSASLPDNVICFTSAKNKRKH